MQALLVTADWGETQVTWNNQPGTGSTQADAAIGTISGLYNWDVTALAQAWQAGRNYGLELRGPEGSALGWSYGFLSREYGEGPPRLYVSYHLPATITPTATRTATRTATPHADRHTPRHSDGNQDGDPHRHAHGHTAAGATATATATRTTTGTPWTQITLYPVADSFVDQANPNANYGTDLRLVTGQTGLLRGHQPDGADPFRPLGDPRPGAHSRGLVLGLQRAIVRRRPASASCPRW